MSSDRCRNRYPGELFRVIEIALSGSHSIGFIAGSSAAAWRAYFERLSGSELTGYVIRACYCDRLARAIYWRSSAARCSCSSEQIEKMIRSAQSWIERCGLFVYAPGLYLPEAIEPDRLAAARETAKLAATALAPVWSSSALRLMRAWQDKIMPNARELERCKQISATIALMDRVSEIGAEHAAESAQLSTLDGVFRLNGKGKAR